MSCLALVLAFTLSPSSPVSFNEPPAGAVRKDRKGIEQVYVPAGPFTMGSDKNREEQPIRTVTLSGFWIGKTDVTVEQFKRFADQTHYAYDWDGNKPQWGWINDNPMVKITWDDARAFCKWADADLPTEAQWEKAARGTDAREYPWGNNFEPTFVWWSKDGKKGSAGSTASVASLPKDASPYGCLDMAGNAWQWCLDWFSRDGYDATDLKDPKGPLGGRARVLRGGAWVTNTEIFFRTSSRIGQAPGNQMPGVSFRICSPG